MIKTNELRLGNIVSVNKGFEMYVSAIFKDTVYLDFEGNQGDVWEEKEEDVFLVPLTQEHLLNFGFEAKSHYDNFILNSFEVSSTVRVISTNKRSCFYLSLTEDSIFNIKIDTVHQLQNLYFALTNEELTIKK